MNSGKRKRFPVADGFVRRFGITGRKRETIQQDACAAAMAEIRGLKVDDLCVAGKRTRIPFPGMGDTGDRPGGAISFIGTPQLTGLLNAWNELIARSKFDHCLVRGPKGLGKSCLLRALACTIFCTTPTTSKEKLVCIWNLDAHRMDIAAAMREALLFTYCMEDSMVASIKNLASLNDVHEFLKREETSGSRFRFIIDSAQALDLCTSLGAQRQNTAAWVKSQPEFITMLNTRTVFWGVSPRALKPERFSSFHLSSSYCQEETYNAYMSSSVLGHLGNRQEDIDYHAGVHPLFLDVLEECCVLQIQDEACEFDCSHYSLAERAGFVEDDEAWSLVLLRFYRHPMICSIWTNFRTLAKRLQWSLPCHSLIEMMKLDPRYAYLSELDPGESQYASRFIEKRYIEEFRSLEAQAGTATPWLDYMRWLMNPENGTPNWSELGWLIGRAFSEVITRRGISISPLLDISRVTLFKFHKPGMKAEPSIGQACYYCPLLNNYPSIDGLIVWRDAQGKLHLVALQVTVSPEDHQHSAAAFMNIRVVEDWIPDALKKVRSSEWTLHFVFLSLGNRTSEDVGEKVTRTKDVTAGTLGYRLHHISLQDGFGRRVGNDVLDLLNQMMLARNPYEPKVPSPEPLPVTSQLPVSISRAFAKRLYRRHDLEVLAKSAGIGDPSKKIYKNMDLLLDALVAEKVFVLT